MTAGFVLDSSAALTWCFRGESTSETIALLRRLKTEAVAVPSLWYLELTNVVALAERKGRITPAQVTAFMKLVEGFELDVDDHAATRAFTDILPLCRSYNLTSYDAAYLELALRRQLPLATLDQELRTAAIAAGVKLML